jgi:hypothetical protein
MQGDPRQIYNNYTSSDSKDQKWYDEQINFVFDNTKQIHLDTMHCKSIYNYLYYEDNGYFHHKICNLRILDELIRNTKIFNKRINRNLIHNIKNGYDYNHLYSSKGSVRAYNINKDLIDNAYILFNRVFNIPDKTD